MSRKKSFPETLVLEGKKIYTKAYLFMESPGLASLSNGEIQQCRNIRKSGGMTKDERPGDQEIQISSYKVN